MEEIETIITEVVAIINEVTPIIEGTLIKNEADKIAAENWLNSKIDLVKGDIAKEKLALLYAKLGSGLLKDEAKLVGYNLELDGLNWALDKVTNYTPAA